MRYRKLRIAWSVAWGLAAVLLIVLWVRSYVISDTLTGPITTTKKLLVGSLAGAIQFRLDDPDPSSFHWQTTAQSVAELNRLVEQLYEMHAALGSKEKLHRIDMTLQLGWDGNTFFLPYWLLVLMSCASTTSPWVRQLKWQFNTRTLLIVTTLVAVVLGLIVWLR